MQARLRDEPPADVAPHLPDDFDWRSIERGALRTLILDDRYFRNLVVVARSLEPNTRSVARLLKQCRPMLPRELARDLIRYARNAPTFPAPSRHAFNRNILRRWPTLPHRRRRAHT